MFSRTSTKPPLSRPLLYPDTPINHSSASQRGSEQTRSLIAPRIFEGISTYTYRDVGGFSLSTLRTHHERNEATRQSKQPKRGMSVAGGDTTRIRRSKHRSHNRCSTSKKTFSATNSVLTTRDTIELCPAQTRGASLTFPSDEMPQMLSRVSTNRRMSESSGNCPQF